MHFLAPIPIILLVVGIIKFAVLGILVLTAAIFFKLAFRILGSCMRLVFGHPSRCYSRNEARPIPPRAGGPPATMARPMPPRPVMMHREIRPPQRPPAQPVQPVQGHYQIPSRPSHRQTPSWSLFAVGIIFFCLVALGFRSFKNEFGNSSGNRKTNSSTEVNPKWVVTGVGLNDEQARKDALEKAQKKLVHYLNNLNPPVEFVPSVDYVEKSLKMDWTEETPNPELQELGAESQWRLQVEVTPKDQDDLWSMDKTLRIEQRQFSVFKILAIVVALLVAIAGYVRLDEWSKGFYTTWLRLGAAGVIGAAGAGIWLLMQ
jgi:hypothetical protein